MFIIIIVVCVKHWVPFFRYCLAFSLIFEAEHLMGLEVMEAEQAAREPQGSPVSTAPQHQPEATLF